ncbi:hypothetical protein FPOAC1_012717 [Fusarium poae]|uniref:hypothetical protein n=1 Tax=Fusarium poae TaxID=36050 RepID=UPI001CE7B68C|nr:hypothetical protein FPOAC1_012717 [Fusarium poae]KAG8667878.1 hypothetical protein FPOAC1_012717 [Fusarium poae]
MADWAKIPAKSLGLVKSTNRSLLKVLQSEDQYLRSIHGRFLNMMREQRENGRKLNVACFFEELALPAVGKVVSKDSATFEGYDPISIHADHADMVKFRSAEENGFKRVVGVLTAWESEIDDRCLTTIQPETNASTGNISVDAATKSRPHYLPFTRNKNFTGRNEAISELQKLLFTHSDGSRVALVGLGGAGKTQTALQLAHLTKNHSQSHYSVIWISALSKASFEQSCIEMIKVFKIKHPADKDPRETFKDFLGSDEAGKWFLIIDNADDKEILYGTGSGQGAGGIAQFIPDCEQGYILLTTRSHDIAASFSQTNFHELTGMDMKDARALLQNSLKRKGQMQDTAMADKLLQELAYLPLAITQASAYMNTSKIPIKEYLRLLQNTSRDKIELLSVGVYDSTHYTNRQGAVLTTWIVSFKQIRASHEDAAKLLSFVACLEPKAIPRALLPRLESEQSMTSAIGTLCSYGFFNRREDSDMFDMHSLVHLATQIWIRDEGHENRTQQLAFEHVAKVFPTDDWENREVWRQYLPHALRLLRSLDSNKSQKACDLGYWVGRCLRQDGKIRQAVELLEHVVAIQNMLPEDSPDRLKSQHSLALAYRDNRQIKEAVQLLEHVVTVQKTLAEDHPSRLASQHVLASAYKDNGQIKEAVQLLEHVNMTTINLYHMNREKKNIGT